MLSCELTSHVMSSGTEIDDLVEWWSVAASQARSHVDQSDNPFRVLSWWPGPRGDTRWNMTIRPWCKDISGSMQKHNYH
jgi:hypothetical protein